MSLDLTANFLGVRQTNKQKKLMEKGQFCPLETILNWVKGQGMFANLTSIMDDTSHNPRILPYVR